MSNAAPPTLFNPDFEVSVSNTDVQATWRKHGWRPTTDDDRAERRRKQVEKYTILNANEQGAP